MPLLLSRDDALAVALIFHALHQAVEAARDGHYRERDVDVEVLQQTLEEIRHHVSTRGGSALVPVLPVLQALSEVIEKDTLPPTNCYTCTHERGTAESPDCVLINDKDDDDVLVWWEPRLVEISPGAEVYYIKPNATGCPGHKFTHRVLDLLQVRWPDEPTPADSVMRCYRCGREVQFASSAETWACSACGTTYRRADEVQRRTLGQRYVEVTREET